MIRGCTGRILPASEMARMFILTQRALATTPAVATARTAMLEGLERGSTRPHALLSLIRSVETKDDLDVGLDALKLFHERRINLTKYPEVLSEYLDACKRAGSPEAAYEIMRDHVNLTSARPTKETWLSALSLHQDKPEEALNLLRFYDYFRLLPPCPTIVEKTVISLCAAGRGTEALALCAERKDSFSFTAATIEALRSAVPDEEGDAYLNAVDGLSSD